MSRNASTRRNAYNRIAAHVTATAPDSISARMQLLNDLLVILPKTHKRAEMVRTSLRFLEHHQQTQMQLPLAFLEELGGGKS